jgi:hypothetical protein
MPVTFSEAGQIQSISVYHNAGTGNVLLGVYSDLSGRPSSLLGVTPSTAVRSTQGWQTVSLTTPVNVTSGQKVWLAWVFENTPYVRYQATATPGSVSAINSTWSSAMPSTFGTNWNANYKFSVLHVRMPYLISPNLRLLLSPFLRLLLHLLLLSAVLLPPTILPLPGTF